MTKLWKLNPITGFWCFVRECSEDTAQQWLDVFINDEPEGVFKLSKNKPKLSHK